MKPQANTEPLPNNHLVIPKQHLVTVRPLKRENEESHF